MAKCTDNVTRVLLIEWFQQYMCGPVLDYRQTQVH